MGKLELEQPFAITKKIELWAISKANLSDQEDLAQYLLIEYLKDMGYSAKRISSTECYYGENKAIKIAVRFYMNDAPGLIPGGTVLEIIDLKDFIEFVQSEIKNGVELWSNKKAQNT